MLRYPSRFLRLRSIFLTVCVLSVVEVAFHARSYSVRRPTRPLDEPFSTQCREPDILAPRQNAAILMLARNEDLEKAAESIAYLEQQFNRWFHYPIVFLNDKPWEQEFIDALTKIASGDVKFDVIPEAMWGYPDWIDQSRARKAMDKLSKGFIRYAGMESYHHMCRFNSGMFYDHPALKPYKWYWRVEPGVWFACAITYDPFLEMAKSGKKYGHAMALWEIGNTSATLFDHVSEYRKSKKLPSTDFWKSVVDASWVPWPFRPLMSRLATRDAAGDAWNLCHYWSNFEIADMDFFRSNAYRDFFASLDKAGGFYYERWGDAPVHSLAAHLFLKRTEIHYFRDLGYGHQPFLQCPGNALGGQLPESPVLGNQAWTEEVSGALGCRCQCDPKDVRGKPPPYCINTLRQSLEPFAIS